MQASAEKLETPPQKQLSWSEYDSPPPSPDKSSEEAQAPGAPLKALPMRQDPSPWQPQSNFDSPPPSLDRCSSETDEEPPAPAAPCKAPPPSGLWHWVPSKRHTLQIAMLPPLKRCARDSPLRPISSSGLDNSDAEEDAFAFDATSAGLDHPAKINKCGAAAWQSPSPSKPYGFAPLAYPPPPALRHAGGTCTYDSPY